LQVYFVYNISFQLTLIVFEISNDMIWSLCGVSVGFLGEVVQLSKENRWLPGHSRYLSQETLLLMFCIVCTSFCCPRTACELSLKLLVCHACWKVLIWRLVERRGMEETMPARYASCSLRRHSSWLASAPLPAPCVAATRAQQMYVIGTRQLRL